jgi:hypothetical protein
MAVLVTATTDIGLQSRWVGLRGGDISSIAPQPVPQDAKLVELLPGSYDSVGYLFKTGSRSALYAEGDKRVQLDTSLHGDWGLVRDAAGTPTMRRLVSGGPLEVRPLYLE